MIIQGIIRTGPDDANAAVCVLRTAAGEIMIGVRKKRSPRTIAGEVKFIVIRGLFLPLRGLVVRVLLIGLVVRGCFFGGVVRVLNVCFLILGDNYHLAEGIFTVP
jgi:hypothetical protein